MLKTKIANVSKFDQVLAVASEATIAHLKGLWSNGIQRPLSKGIRTDGPRVQAGTPTMKKPGNQ